jgi:hypothetical protein
MNLFVLTILLIISSSAKAVQIRNPLHYSKSVARDFASGDSGRPKEYDCRHERDEELEVGGNIQIISCDGIRDVLVFGGHMTTTRFECRFNFEPLTDDWKYLQVTYENCY